MSSDDADPRSPSTEETQPLDVPSGARRAGGPRRRRPSAAALAVFLAVGAIAGGVAGVLFTRWSTGGNEDATTADVGPVPPQPVSIAPLPSSAPEIVFSNSKKRPETTPDLLEAGVTQVFCFFTVPGESPSADPVAWWLNLGDEPIEAEGEIVKEEGDDLRGHIALKPPPGAKAFEDGVYELALFVDGEQVIDGSFAMLKGAAELVKRPRGMERYRPEIKEVVVSAGAPPRKPKKPFVLPAGADKVTVTFKYSHALSGTAFTVRWLYEDGLIQQATGEVVIQAASGKGEAWFAPKPPGRLPVGKYGVLISLGEDTPPLAREAFWIGRKPRREELAKPR